MNLFDFLAALLSASYASEPSSGEASEPPSAEHLPSLLPHVPGTIVYYSLDGSAAFRFKFEAQAGGGIRIYVIEQPAYGNRDAGSHPTHRLSDSGRWYICFEPLPRTREDARKVAKAWAELTLKYIKNGERF